jgi:hypothetical protein
VALRRRDTPGHVSAAPLPGAVIGGVPRKPA